MKKGDAQSKASPPVKVVGFRVEGASPSPRETSLADAAGAASTVTGSPSPVIIPPAFTGQSRGGDATPTMRGAGAAATTPGSVSSAPYHDDAAEAAGLPPIRTEPAAGLDPDSFAKDRTPTKAVASPPGRALPLTPVGTSAQKAAADAGVAPAKLTAMFAHLPVPRGVTLQSVAQQKGPPVPLVAAKLGLQYADGSLRGGNARCIAMLQMFVQCIQDFRTPPGREFAKEFSPALNNIINFLVACRPLSVSMGNAIKSIKSCLEKMKLQPPPSEQQAKDQLVEKIQDYLEQKIRFADRMLVKHAIEKIQDGDTIMTYAYSSVVAATLLAAHKAGKRFDVVVVDSRPLFEGRRMLTTLLAGGITCEYCHLNGLSYEITEVDKVFLGAASVLSNGAVLSRVGTAAVALMAAAQRVPVLVCCESYKFHERVQLDSITHNELLDQRLLATVPDRADVPAMPGWQAKGGAPPAPVTPDDKEKRVHLLNLAYDLTPADVVTVVITEMGAVPPTSVAVILRESVRDAAVL